MGASVGKWDNRFAGTPAIETFATVISLGDLGTRMAAPAYKRTVMKTGFAALFVICAIGRAQVRAEDNAREIVQRSVSKDLINWSLAKDYTYLIRDQDKELDKSGKVKKTESTVEEVSHLYGEPYTRLIEKDGKALPDKDSRKEEDKLAKFMAKREHETDQQREKRLAEREKRRAKEREFLKEVVDAYDLKLIGEDKIDGHDAYVIAAEPRPGYHGKADDAKYFSKIRGKIWIDKAEYQWVKVEAETIDTISFGLVLFRLYKGAHLQFEQARVNEEIWLPKHVHIEAAGRVGLVLRGSIEADSRFENYRKFQTDSHMVSASELK
jgi:hypothetical protein